MPIQGFKSSAEVLSIVQAASQGLLALKPFVNCNTCAFPCGFPFLFNRPWQTSTEINNFIGTFIFYSYPQNHFGSPPGLLIISNVKSCSLCLIWIQVTKPNQIMEKMYLDIYGFSRLKPISRVSKEVNYEQSSHHDKKTQTYILIWIYLS